MKALVLRPDAGTFDEPVSARASLWLPCPPDGFPGLDRDRELMLAPESSGQAPHRQSGRGSRMRSPR
jgi:hypothetical protein